MITEITTMLFSALGFIVGTLIGAGFGAVQESARRRNERLQDSGKLKNGWAVMPGSGRRVVYLILALVLIQIVCPLLFNDGVQWCVSAGVAAGYGAALYRQLVRRKVRGT